LCSETSLSSISCSRYHYRCSSHPLKNEAGEVRYSKRKKSVAHMPQFVEWAMVRGGVGSSLCLVHGCRWGLKQWTILNIAIYVKHSLSPTEVLVKFSPCVSRNKPAWVEPCLMDIEFHIQS
jgi:hypothetical protein